MHTYPRLIRNGHQKGPVYAGDVLVFAPTMYQAIRFMRFVGRGMPMEPVDESYCRAMWPTNPLFHRWESPLSAW